MTSTMERRVDELQKRLIGTRAVCNLLAMNPTTLRAHGIPTIRLGSDPQRGSALRYDPAALLRFVKERVHGFQLKDLPEAFLRTADVARLLSVTSTTVANLRETDQIGYVQFGPRTLRYDPREVERVIQARQEAKR